MKEKILLLDVFAILFRAYYSIPDLKNKEGFSTGALFGLTNTILNLINQFKPTHIIACLDSKERTHRQGYDEGYKATRSSPEPELVEQIEELSNLFKALNIRTLQKPGFEADDILGTLAVEYKKDHDVVIATGDYDILQLLDDGVNIFMLKKGIRNTKVYNRESFIEEFSYDPILIPDFKGFCGDPSDNIKGVAGIGKKGASSLIENFQTVENVFSNFNKDVELLKNAGVPNRTLKALEGSEAEALASKALATIVTDLPLSHELSSVSWKDGFTSEYMKEYFTNLDFIAFIDRLERITGQDVNPIQNLSPEEIRELGTMLWIIDSDYTNPTQEEILSFTKCTSYDMAKEVLLGKIKNEKNLNKVWEEIEKPLLTIIPQIESIGLLADKDYLCILEKKYFEQVEALKKEIYKLSGVEFNIKSPKQLSEVLTQTLNLKLGAKTSSGLKSTKESSLLKLKDKHEIIASILKFRHKTKILDTYIKPFLLLMDEKGRIRTTLLQNGTTTGRFSSKNPNLQNVPKEKDEGGDVRNSIIARKGFSLLSVDYSQIDLRMAAWLSKDPNLCDILNSEEDIHVRVASKVHKVTLEEVTKQMRFSAKAINYGMLYGMGTSSFASATGHTREESKAFFEQYKKAFPLLHKYLEDTKIFAKKNGYVETGFFRRRPIHGMNSSLAFLYSRAERVAINAPIQGSTADVIKIAMIKIFEQIKGKEDIYMALQVHDDLLFEVKDDKMCEYATAIENMMCQNILPEDACVKLAVAKQKGKRWGDMEDF